MKERGFYTTNQEEIKSKVEYTNLKSVFSTKIVP